MNYNFEKKESADDNKSIKKIPPSMQRVKARVKLIAMACAVNWEPKLQNL